MTDYIAINIIACDASHEPTDDIVIGSYSTFELAEKAIRNHMKYYYIYVIEEDEESVNALINQQMTCDNGTYMIVDEISNNIWMIVETIKDFIPDYKY